MALRRAAGHRDLDLFLGHAISLPRNRPVRSDGSKGYSVSIQRTERWEVLKQLGLKKRDAAWKRDLTGISENGDITRFGTTIRST